MTYISQMLHAYVTCALWNSSDDEDDRSLQQRGFTYADVHDDTRSEMAAECLQFWERARVLLENIDPGDAGHDFWLTRGHEGTGFWDRGLGAVGDQLTQIAHSFGERSLYIGGDGKIHST